MLRIVIDTNLFVSGLISKKGHPAKLVDLWKKGEFHLCISKKIIEEIFEVLYRPRIKERFKIPREDIEDLRKEILEKAIISLNTYEVEKSRDPKDNIFLACAMEEEAHYLISGDDDLLSLKYYQGIQIVDVNIFLKILEQQK